MEKDIQEVGDFTSYGDWAYKITIPGGMELHADRLDMGLPLWTWSLIRAGDRKARMTDGTVFTTARHAFRYALKRLGKDLDLTPGQVARFREVAERHNPGWLDAEEDPSGF